MATATFDDSGNIVATGKEAMPNVAEGLGASNIKGVDDSKVKTDIDNEEGRKLVNESPETDRPPQAEVEEMSRTPIVRHPQMPL
ncbi:g5642 [Coccomyxa viridis]|uniref:G5642 protein n=1 Tax=Coccomyxa viridis TaxID=1274662 RepID=A0ABP1FTD6_9CHLO